MDNNVYGKDPFGDFPSQEELYLCAKCGKLRTKDEGITTFTVCDECWDKHYKKQPDDKREKLAIIIGDYNEETWKSIPSEWQERCRNKADEILSVLRG